MMNYEIKEVPMSSEVRTEEVETLNPTTANTKTFKFRLHNTGFMDSTSMLTFKLVKSSSAGGGDRLRPNLWNGVLGGIESAIMTCGDFIISETQKVNEIATLRHLNKSQTVRNDLYGHYLGSNLKLFIDSTNGTSDNFNGADRAKGQIRNSIQSGLDYGQQNDGSSSGIRNKSIVTNKSNCDKYGIPLYMLFPALENRQLPLFLMKDYPIILEINFKEPSEYINNLANHPSYKANDTDVEIHDCKLVVDYILPPASVLSKYEEQTAKEGGYRFEYPKFSLVKKALPAMTGSRVQQEVEHRLGQENKEVHCVYQLKQFTGAKTSNVADKILLEQRIDGADTEEFNVEINGEDVYRDFVFNCASQYNELEQCLDEPLKVPRSMYFNDCNTAISHLSCLQSGLTSVYKPLGCDLRNGTQLINGGGTIVQQGSPLVFKYKRNSSTNIANVQFDNTPAMNVNYHIVNSGLAVIKKLPVGTSVQVKN